MIAIQDVATGEVVELDATRASGPDGYNEAPPGRRTAATPVRPRLDWRHDPRRPALDTATFLVDADGSNLRQLTDTALFVGMGLVAGRLDDRVHVGHRLARRGPVRQARELQRGQRRLHGARRRLGCSAADEFRAHARGPWRPCAGGRAVAQAGPATGGSSSPCTHGPDEGDSTNLPPEIWIMASDGSNARQIDGSRYGEH